jgi:hypothetical protein
MLTAVFTFVLLSVGLDPFGIRAARSTDARIIQR